jgi:hypothetical protein
MSLLTLDRRQLGDLLGSERSEAIVISLGGKDRSGGRTSVRRGPGDRA